MSLFEIKSAGDKFINEGAENLLKLKKLINTEKMNKPSFKMTITGIDKYAYQIPDSIYIVPIGCLKN